MTLLEKLVPRPRRARGESSCVACGAEIVLSAETFNHNGYAIHRCSACRTLVTAPLPSSETLQAYYSRFNETYTGGMGEVRYGREMPLRWAARLDVIERCGAQQGRLLDIGGSNGMFGALAHARGFRVDVTDYIPAPKDLGFTVAVPADISVRGGTPFADATFDVVTLWSCIEHVRDPEQCLDETARLVRPGGLFAIDTPLVGDLCEGLFAARSHWICPPEHLHLFSARGLRLAVERAGFEVVFASSFFERTVARWVARRGRNLSVATRGLLIRAFAPDRWMHDRDTAETQAGDIQFLVARKPLG